MRSYTLHLPREAHPGSPHGLDRAVLVRDGFSWSAFAFTALWFFYHRLWIAGVGVLVGLIALAMLGRSLGLSAGAGTAVTLLAAALIGLEASSLRRWTLARRGRPVRDAVVAGSAEEAEMKALTRWLDPATVRAPGTPYAAGGSRAGEGVIGLFPLREGGR